MYIEIKNIHSEHVEPFDTDAFDDYDDLKAAVFEYFRDDDAEEAEEEPEFSDIFEVVGIDEEFEGERNAFMGNIEKYWDSGYAGLDSLEKEYVMAYYDNVGGTFDGHLIAEAQEAFEGTYKNDEDFAYHMAEETGAIDNSASWPYTCIDWEQAAKELMYDYFESNGFYFRNI